MSVDDRLRLAHLGLHPGRTRRLLGEWGTAGAVLRAVERGQVNVGEAVRAAAAVPAPVHEEHLAALGARFVTREHPDVPERLAGLPDAPDALFVRGELPAGRAVAVVGTRRCTGYGRSLARSFAVAIARAGWVLVSGLARGIDGEAHTGTTEGEGKGVAVLGSGIDVCYPAEHRSLAAELVRLGGAVVTEYPPGTAPEGWRFPPRNRIISGLADAVVVVEAGRTGGALITANAALEHGRPVLVVPGDVDRPASEGCNLLIRDGAHPVLGVDDLVEALSLVLGPPRPRPGPAPPPAADGLLTLLVPPGRTVDELAVASGDEPGAVMGRLARLEAAGLVRREGSLVVAT